MWSFSYSKSKEVPNMVNNNSADIVGTNKVNDVDSNKLPGNDIDTSNSVESENTETVTDRMLNDIDTTGDKNTNNIDAISNEHTDNSNGNKDNNTKKSTSSNLIDLRDRTTEEQRRIAYMGGKASGEARRKKRDLKEIARAVLAAQMSEGQIEEVLGNAQSLLEGDKSVAAVLTVRMVQEAGEGNYKAYETLRDTAGYKPKEQMEIETFTEYDRQLLDNVSKRLPNKNA